MDSPVRGCDCIAVRARARAIDEVLTRQPRQRARGTWPLISGAGEVLLRVTA